MRWHPWVRYQVVLLLLMPRLGSAVDTGAQSTTEPRTATVAPKTAPAAKARRQKAALIGAAQSDGARVPAGPPANLKAGAFDSLVASMWRDSPTFRRQCLRLAAERTLTVTLRADTSGLRSSARALTSMSYKSGALVAADIVLFSIGDATELIAHEIEHVIEQLDDIVLTDGCGRITARDGRMETCRAVEAGQRVAREVQEAHQHGRLKAIRQDSFNGPLDPSSAAVSASGRFIVLRSEARLVSADINDRADLYVLDLETGRLQLESPRPAWADAYTGLLYPRISGDGRLLVFQAVTADNAAPDGRRWDIVTIDRAGASVGVIRVKPSDGPARVNGTPAISADGDTVAFQSTPRAGAEGQKPTTDIYLARLRTGHVERVSVAAQSSSEGNSVTPAVSADGRYVAFMATADLTCGDTRPCRQSDGRRTSNIYLRDTIANVTTRITRSTSGGEPNGPSSWPAISGDGRIVAFVSEASNLVKGDKNGQSDVFVHDRLTGTTMLVSHRPDGQSGNGASRHPAISGDGETVAFQSLASNLLCTKRCTNDQRDINLLWDVFVYERSSRTMIRASGDETGAWMEPSHGPSLDHSGRVLIFSSRHPIDDQDVNNDDDLYVWLGRARTGQD